MLATLIDLLRKNQDQLDSGMLYLSDHGESLGEYNLYLHGAPYLMAPEQQRHVSMFAWFSKGYQRDFNVSSQCLRDEHERPLSHDNLFHSMLGLLQVDTQAYDARLDLFAHCRSQSTEVLALTHGKNDKTRVIQPARQSG